MNDEAERVRDDFDRIALLPTAASRYDDFVLAQVPPHCRRALEIGCGTGLFARRLAQQAGTVLAVDFSPVMIDVARSESAQHHNLELRVGDVTELQLPDQSFDCCVSMATLHHLPFELTLDRLAGWLAPGGVMVIHDLFRDGGVLDRMLSAVALATELPRRLRRRPNEAARKAWAAHSTHDHLMTLPEIRRRALARLPGARIIRHLHWRYTLTWRRPG